MTNEKAYNRARAAIVSEWRDNYELDISDDDITSLERALAKEFKQKVSEHA